MPDGSDSQSSYQGPRHSQKLLKVPEMSPVRFVQLCTSTVLRHLEILSLRSITIGPTIMGQVGPPGLCVDTLAGLKVVALVQNRFLD